MINTDKQGALKKAEEVDIVVRDRQQVQTLSHQSGSANPELPLRKRIYGHWP
jgi:hypothetical protein